MSEEIKLVELEVPIGIIYQILSPDGKKYIGSTANGVGIEKRMIEHRCEAKAGNEYRLYVEMRRLGSEKFIISEIETTRDTSDLNLRRREQHYIDLWDTFANGLNGKNATLECAHGPDRRRCASCGGCNMCEHGIQRYQCRACGGAGFCKEHNNPKSRCVQCEGGSTCDCMGERKEKRYCIYHSGCRYCCVLNTSKHQKTVIHGEYVKTGIMLTVDEMVAKYYRNKGVTIPTTAAITLG